MNFQKKILVIEDDLMLGNTIQNVLAHHQFDVCFANNGAAGIQKAFEYNPDLILCDINMDPIDGYQVYKLLEESSILKRVPFIFLTGSSDIEDMRYGMSLGADDYLVKPFLNVDLIKTIGKRLDKFATFREEANREFRQLLNISPLAFLLFDMQKVHKWNHAFLKLWAKNDDLTGMKIEDVFDKESVQRLRETINRHIPGVSEIFNDEVVIKTGSGSELRMKMAVSEFDKFSNYTVFLGMITPPANQFNHSEIDGYAEKVRNLLNRENIKISDALGEKITDIFKQRKLNISVQCNPFFTKRESQILCLTMEGLPIKAIADRLAISDRTVEKHRASLMEKSGANNMIEVIVFALRNSLVEI